MMCGTCESSPCTCQKRAQMPPIRSTYTALPLGITKEEFGVNLYDTIKLVGGAIGLHEQIAGAVHKGEGYKIQGLIKRRDAIYTQLRLQIQTLTPFEYAEVLTRYPMIGAL